ncbi:MAG: M28 family peptidase [Myxococcota bacterium]
MRLEGFGRSRIGWAIGLAAGGALAISGCASWTGRGDGALAASEPRASEPALYRDARPLTFAGRRTGEGYFSPDGRSLVFQSEREPGNPFYQIYRWRLTTGELDRISPGLGRASCAWFHPDGERILFASTHEDPGAELAQALELEKRAAGRTDRYSWDFDAGYDLFVAEPDGSLTPLAKAEGYDAEGSFSPDGRFVVFASNRHAYEEPLSADERDRLARDPSYFVDLYRLELATGALVRLTETPGYDGGPFHSPDGSRIVWRRFSEDGARAEIHAMNVDGRGARALTHLGVMSWAPFFHPSGDYIVFSTNLHGFDDFELYLVDAEGERDPVRVTERAGFDGLPVFAPTGDVLVWTSNRTEGKQSQLFRADWNDTAAREALGLATRPAALLPFLRSPLATAPAAPGRVRPDDIAAHVAALTDPRTGGRGTGQPGEALAAEHVEAAMSALGLVPAGDDGRFLHRFEYSAGIALGEGNALRVERAGTGPAPAHGASTPPRPVPDAGPIDAATPSPIVDTDWRPLAFSTSGEISPRQLVFAGYGLVAPAEREHPAVDEYAGLDLAGRWALVLRDLPGPISGERRQHLQRYASLRHKAMIARDRGAVGIVFVNGPRSGFREPLAPLRFDAAIAGSGLAVISASEALVDRWLAASGRTLAESQDRIDTAFAPPEGSPSSDSDAGSAAGDEGDAGPESNAAAVTDAATELRFELADVRLGARIALETLRSTSHNVIGRLQVGGQPSRQTIVLGAHLDHLGRGEGSGSLADASEAGQIHPGADDNASGVAVLLEIARSLARRRAAGESLGQRDFVFAAWSGEELGLLGSDAWVDRHVGPHAREAGPVAYLNFDMVGRLGDELVVHGAGSSLAWDALIEQAALPGPLALALRDDADLPTDSTSFYTRGLPVLSAFTGVHAEYHTPRDRPELLNFEGAAAIADLFARVAVLLSRAPEPPAFEARPLAAGSPNRGGLRVYLGTIPDYSETDVRGVRLSGVSPGGPADAAGLQRGDTIVEVDGQPIENLYDFTYALEALRVGQTARIVILRDGRRTTLPVVPRSRD